MSEKARNPARILNGHALLALPASLALFACIEPMPLTPAMAGAIEGRKFANENRDCPPRWRDERGVISEEQLNRAFFEGVYDDERSLAILDEYRRAYDDACESQLLSPRSDV